MDPKKLTFALVVGIILVLIFGMLASCSGSGHHVHHHHTTVVHVHKTKTHSHKTYGRKKH